MRLMTPGRGGDRDEDTKSESMKKTRSAQVELFGRDDLRSKSQCQSRFYPIATTMPCDARIRDDDEPLSSDVNSPSCAWRDELTSNPRRQQYPAKSFGRAP